MKIKNVDAKTNERMSSGMDRIVALVKSVHETSRRLNAERIALCMQIHDWVAIAVDSGAVATKSDAHHFIANRTKLASKTIDNMHRVGSYIEEHKLDTATVQFQAVFQCTAYPNALPATKLKMANAVRMGVGGAGVRKILLEDRTVRESMTHRRAFGAIQAGTLTKDALKIEMMAVQTMAKHLFGKDIIVTVTDQDYVPLVTVGYAKRVLA